MEPADQQTVIIALYLAGAILWFTRYRVHRLAAQQTLTRTRCLFSTPTTCHACHRSCWRRIDAYVHVDQSTNR